MDEPADRNGVRAELGWFARNGLRDLLEDAAWALAIGAIVVGPAIVGYLVAGRDGIVPGLVIGAALAALGLLWVLVSSARDLVQWWRRRGSTAPVDD